MKLLAMLTVSLALVGAGAVAAGAGTLTVAPAAGGTVTGTGINCPGDCTDDYAAECVPMTGCGEYTQYTNTLTALPDTGSTFLGWSCLVVDSGGGFSSCGPGCIGTGTCAIDVFSNFSVDVAALFGTLAARFRGLSTTASARGTVVRWRTASELDAAGFNVYRAWHARRTRLNRRLVPAVGGAAGHAYRWLDRGARRTGSRYWIQAVNLDGSFSWFGPAAARLG
jgi:hypothetical protein